MSEGFDKTDRKIISQLIENSKMMSKELSKKLKIHPNTLLQRLKKLREHGAIIKYGAVVDFDKLEPGFQALIFLNIEMIPDWEVHLRPISRFPEVVSFILITGAYDAVVIARVKHEKNLASLLRRFQANKVVTKTTTHLILDRYKHSHEYNPFEAEFKF
ncbi:MAG: Lrp/AsnC family transcriptional regulator [Candidatus Micrarchaeota archaeon]